MEQLLIHLWVLFVYFGYTNSYIYEQNEPISSRFGQKLHRIIIFFRDLEFTDCSSSHTKKRFTLDNVVNRHKDIYLFISSGWVLNLYGINCLPQRVLYLSDPWIQNYLYGTRRGRKYVQNLWKSVEKTRSLNVKPLK